MRADLTADGARSAGDAAEDHRDPLAGRRAAGVGEQAGEAGAAGDADRDAGARGEVVGLGDRRLGHDERPAARPLASTSKTPSQS